MDNNFSFSSLSAEQRKEIIDIAAESGNEAEMGEKLRKAGYEIGEEALGMLFKRVNTPPPLGDLSDDELENVSGGCGGSSCSDCKNYEDVKPEY